MQKIAIGSWFSTPVQFAAVRFSRLQRYKGTLTQTLLVMKLTMLLLAAALLNVHAEGVAQHVTISGKDISLSQVFAAIKKQTGYVVFYNKQMLSRSRPVSLSVYEVPLAELLEVALKDQPILFLIEGKNIILSEKPLPVPRFDAFPITLRVLDSTGAPLAGASLSVKNGKQLGVTNAAGIASVDLREGDVLMVSFVGYELRAVTITKEILETASLSLTMRSSIARLEEVSVVSTGYQQLRKEHVTGSFVSIDNKLFNRRLTGDVLSRLEGIVPGMFFNPSTTRGSGKTGINIRGQSSMSVYVNPDPLIVLDNFPYEGNINNINPNDIENVTILRDAAAASIWGARSANGVIVITTKKGRLNRKMNVELNVNFNLGLKPDVFKDENFISSSSYIGLEKDLFANGYYDQVLSNAFRTFPAYSPVVDILDRQNRGVITLQQAEAELDVYGANDIRKEYRKHIQQNMLNQRYSLGISGGGTASTYYFSIGYDRNGRNITNAWDDRLTLTATNSYMPLKNLTITTNLNFSENTGRINNNFTNWSSIRGPYGKVAPYYRLMDDNGQPLSIPLGHNAAFIDSLYERGFLDWYYRPLDEIGHMNNSNRLTDILLQASIQYKIFPFLQAVLHFQSERQTGETRILQSPELFYVRDMINELTQYDPVTGGLSYPFPNGAILELGNERIKSTNWRGQLVFNKEFGLHSISAIAGGELRENTAESYSRVSYGYDDEYGTAATQIDYMKFFPTNGGRGRFIPPPPANVYGSTRRWISYYADMTYQYKDAYTFTLSGRRDGANIFGVKTNDRIAPLWSVGAGWNISKEGFYQVGWLPYLKLRATYGYNGRVYDGAAYLTARFGSVSDFTNLPYGQITSPPNGSLRWEKVAKLTVGADFGLVKNVLNGSLEIYRHKGIDLIQAIPLAPSVGFTSFSGNSAETMIKGLDLQLNGSFRLGKVMWQPVLNFSYITDNVLNFNFDIEYSGKMLATATSGMMHEGRPVTGMYSFRWAGLDPETGDPMGYSGGMPSKNYSVIVNSPTIDSLVYAGNARPPFYGSFRNTFVFGRLSVSANILYKFRYFFRRNTLDLNSQNIQTTYNGIHADYERVWRKPGDEAFTNVPSLSYLIDNDRSEFYRYSEVTVERGDHIRLQDIGVNYDLLLGRQRVQLKFYANNLGIIWRKNNKKIDPDLATTMPTPRSFALGLSTNF